MHIGVEDLAREGLKHAGIDRETAIPPLPHVAVEQHVCAQASPEADGERAWRPAFARFLHLRYTRLKRELETYIHYYNFDRVHHGRLTQGSIPADVVYGARKMEAR